MRNQQASHDVPRTLGAIALVLLAVGTTTPRSARAEVEIIPSIGMTRAVEGTNETHTSYGLALRGSMGQILRPEIGASFRSESRFNENLRVKMFPITASLWLQPIPAIYAGGGVGWYNTRFDYNQDVVPNVQDETRQEFGLHLGGGVRVPLSSMATVDLHGRYVMMRPQESRLVPEQFDPDFWNANIGLGFSF